MTTEGREHAHVALPPGRPRSSSPAILALGGAFADVTASARERSRAPVAAARDGHVTPLGDRRRTRVSDVSRRRRYGAT
jgi:hypothetical protein